jgi:hypothetical protein
MDSIQFLTLNKFVCIPCDPFFDTTPNGFYFMANKRPTTRLALVDETNMNGAQRILLQSLRAGPRGKSLNVRGPFAAWMHAPEFGQLAQALGAHARYKTTLSPRLSERFRPASSLKLPLGRRSIPLHCFILK